MNTTKLSVFFCLAISIFMAKNTYTAVGCLTGYNGHKQLPSYKPVRCACPCKQQDRTDDRGKCIKCGHYREQKTIVFVETKKDKEQKKH